MLLLPALYAVINALCYDYNQNVKRQTYAFQL